MRRIVAAFRWAAGEGKLPGSVVQNLDSIPGLKRGKCDLREPEPVAPVSDDVIAATLKHLSPTVAAMVELQRATGMRPGELVILRPGDVDRGGNVWRYTPRHHKTENRGKRRTIYVGPRAQVILMPYLLRPAEEYCFQPRQSEAARREAQHASRKTPLSCGNRPGTNRRSKPKRTAGEHYKPDSYRRAVHRACVKAGVEKWSPGQLRHSFATAVRASHGLEPVQHLLGHARCNTSEVYAETNAALAVKVAAEVG